MATLEFDAPDFLECFDEAFLASLDDTLKKRDRNDLYNLLRSEIEKFILSIKNDLKIQKIEVNEIEFMLSVFEIVDNKDTNGLIDLEEFLEHMKRFTSRYRNITKTLDNLNTKLMKQDMRIEKIMKIEHCNYTVSEAALDFGMFFGLFGVIFYFIESLGSKNFETYNITN